MIFVIFCIYLEIWRYYRLDFHTGLCVPEKMGDSEENDYFKPGAASGDDLITLADLEKLQEEFKDRKGKNI